MPNSILHSCCFPGLKRCQCKPFVASVIHPPLSHAPRETHREWWENYLTFWSSAGFFRGMKNDCGVFGFVAICPEQRSVLSRQYSRKNITFMTLLEWNFTVPKPWKPPNFSEVLISSEVKEVQFFFFSCWCWKALRLMLNSPRRVVLSQTITGFTPPAKKAARPLNFEEKLCRGRRSNLWTGLNVEAQTQRCVSLRVCLTLNLPTREIN